MKRTANVLPILSGAGATACGALFTKGARNRRLLFFYFRFDLKPVQGIIKGVTKSRNPLILLVGMRGFERLSRQTGNPTGSIDILCL
jgi:hypothetical protein